MRNEQYFSQQLEQLANDPEGLRKLAGNLLQDELDAFARTVFTYSTQPMTDQGLEQCIKATYTAKDGDVALLLKTIQPHFQQYNELYAIKRALATAGDTKNLREDYDRYKNEFTALDGRIRDLEVVIQDIDTKYRTNWDKASKKRAPYAKQQGDLFTQRDAIGRKMREAEKALRLDKQKDLDALGRELSTRKTYATQHLRTPEAPKPAPQPVQPQAIYQPPAPAPAPSREKTYTIEELQQMKDIMAPPKIVVNVSALQPPVVINQKTSTPLNTGEPASQAPRELTREELEAIVRSIPDPNKRTAADMLFKQGKIMLLKTFLSKEGIL